MITGQAKRNMNNFKRNFTYAPIKTSLVNLLDTFKFQLKRAKFI